jgi:hypothetical protein
LEVLAAQPVIDAQGPNLKVGKDAVDPGQHDVMPAEPEYSHQPSVLAVVRGRGWRRR